ncbi:MAG: hypothetical protein DI538_20845 [Azospira oryzae]|nr:MAG: hypothetical protein DI538_20845 [Azospira oryzae]
MLIGTPRFLDKIVSDETIEFLHHTLFDQDDPFRRYQQGLDRAEMKFRDREGRTFEVKPRQLFFGTLDMGYRQFLELVKTKRMLWTLTGSVQVGIPLNHARRYLSAGIMTGSAVTFQFKKRYGITIATGYVAQHDNLISIRKKFYDPGYRNFMTGYRFVLAQNFDLKNAHRFSFGIEMQGAPSPLSTKTKVVAPYPNAEDIGVQTSYTPEYWTPDDPIAITNQRRAGRTMIRGSEYISLNFSYRIGKSNHAPTVTFYLQEDWSLVYDLEGASFPLFSMSNNAQDFGAGFRLLKPF